MVEELVETIRLAEVDCEVGPPLASVRHGLTATGQHPVALLMEVLGNTETNPSAGPGHHRCRLRCFHRFIPTIIGR
jgi:hypothetical protein